jgi:phosphatidylglycerophosphatase A
MRRVALALATCGPLGHAPVAPGTFGSAAGLVLYWLVRASGSTAVEATAIVAVIVLGVWSAGVAERHLGQEDPGPVVIDEVAGMLITLAFLPVNLAGAVAGFFLFRVLDIVKPWPAGRLEAWAGGFGVMADDVMAAIYGNLLMRGAMAVLPGWLS